MHDETAEGGHKTPTDSISEGIAQGFGATETYEGDVVDTTVAIGVNLDNHPAHI